MNLDVLYPNARFLSFAHARDLKRVYFSVILGARVCKV